MFGLFALLLSVGGVHAQQKFPTKPIRLIVPAASGDGLDIQARRLALKLTESFEQPVVVDNRPGGNYIIGTKLAVSANPDGIMAPPKPAAAPTAPPSFSTRWPAQR